MTDPILLPLSAMARRLRVTRSWLKVEAENGRVPALKAGRRFLFSPDAVEQYLAERAKALDGNTDKTNAASRPEEVARD